MEKRIILNNQPTNFWIEDTGRLRNEKTKKWLKGGYNKGYHFYSIYFKGKQYILYTHRLVAEYFIPNFEKDKTIVHHKDGNKLNNNVLNLEWVSPQCHNQLIKELGQNKNRRSPQKKIGEIEEYEEIAQFRNTPYYATKDGKILNMSKNIELMPSKVGNYYRINAAYGINKKLLVHRVVWEAFNGSIPKGFEINHIDGNGGNNRLDNLELVMHSENLKKEI